MAVNFKVPVKTKAEVAAQTIAKMAVCLATVDTAVAGVAAAVDRQLKQVQTNLETHIRDTVGVTPHA